MHSIPRVSTADEEKTREFLAFMHEAGMQYPNPKENSCLNSKARTVS